MAQPSLFDPRARTSDPSTSHLAAVRVRPGNAELVKAIRQYVYEYGPSTAFEIADSLEGRWQHDTIRSACARAGLDKVDGGETPRGRPCCVYGLRTTLVSVPGGVL